ncbi:triose-phosphate isomerase [Roseinatronobacter bogoriensis]|uniref:Triosephosphate isomerase n=1 Tax=Roseinatronobacter bogoriensis subsp. barguzinensis TaxID=441209 RepID=A0A2K8KCB6_9RHOB|nr:MULTISPECIES: triose-phosphate isomerase [Rhodobaca]ATX67082.1 triose-phosphate isomerase [Rhodobaca barguzinensis]MBB4206592.1 triosephosphate isomerase [Rhodobaca bogoriensis DSM 18756]TDW41335.1 triosephosphate isomerase [Rhodobaca barguzinensis]TDY74487.1 triosephosphate isomerase [Rhodobaca bogoriensis DSM 18756]
MLQACKLAAGNWKMNGTRADLEQARAIAEAFPSPKCGILLCPPATLVRTMADMLAGSAVMVGGQDCHAQDAGAHTGDISAAMLADAGARQVILGHSERRADHAETSALVAAKASAAHASGLVAIICIGETEAERDSGQTLDVVLTQLKDSVPKRATSANTVIAYEPVWAIGTGRTPTLEQIAEVHDALRAALPDAGISLLYGGSVKPGNAAEIFAIANVDGALVGGASLKAADFGAIIAALEGASD